MTSAFATSFAETLELAPKPLDNNFQGTHAKRPVLFPEIAAARAPSDPTTPAKGTVSVTLKSIRAPKFVVEYTVPAADTVYSLKERLLTDPNGPLTSSDATYTPLSVKLLLKTKVIPDTRQLAELPSLQFTVMLVSAEEKYAVPIPGQLYWSEGSAIGDLPGPTQHEEAAKPSATARRAAAKPGLNDNFWKEVETVARKYVDDPESLVERLKASTAEDIDDIDVD